MASNSGQVANTAAMATIDQREQSLDNLDSQIDQKEADPAYATPMQQKELEKARADVQKGKEALEKEKAVREDIEDAYGPPLDKKALKKAQKALNALRAKEAKYYKKGAKVANPCTSCQKEVAKVKPLVAPKDTPQMADYLTSMFEGGKPDNYCALSQRHYLKDEDGNVVLDKDGDPKLADKGGISFGKHQATEASGSLYNLLNDYANQTDPPPDPDKKKLIQDDLKSFDEDHEWYTGDTTKFAADLKNVCSDPAMGKTQDQFFYSAYYAPAAKSAAKYGVKSPLGMAMFYDMQIQGQDNLAQRAMDNWNKAHPGYDATECDPTGITGPTEQDYLTQLNAARRARDLSLGGDAAKSVYRPDSYDQLMAPGGPGINLDKDFEFRGQPFQGLPPPAPAPAPTLTDGPSPDGSVQG